MGKSKSVKNDYPFYQALLEFYNDEKGIIKKNYKDVSKKILDFNDKSKNPSAFLRFPQFQALEIYVFIKEYLNNAKVKDMFADWYNYKNKFKTRSGFSKQEEGSGKHFQNNFFDDMTADVYNDVFDNLQNQDQEYPNYIYALTMGVGKTILVATCIFYEFILASKFQNDGRFCHNALVFAPDKTVLQSLKEIKTFDFSKVIPKEYVNFITSNIKFYFLDDSSTTLNTVDGSDYNIIISNTQKIILKEIHKEKSATDRFMNNGSEQLGFDLEGLDDFTKGLYGDLDSLKDEKEVTANQRFEKIIRLNQLGVYVDEAHHLFGTDLKSSLSDTSKETSLRYTINTIAKVLEKNSTKMVACFNYTGTPYIENRILPEVVYSYGLKSAIDNGYLKQVEVQGYQNVKNEEFLRKIIKNFFDYYGDSLYEGLKPKLAIFGAEIKEITDEIKPMVEGILNDLGIDSSTILVNVGDSVVTKDCDVFDFNNLDVVGTEGSKKQIILLVNKGREGWNCRSLFSVALYRSPKSRIFVLQSTMRCLRSITDCQQLAHVYLSQDNYNILDEELNKNFNVDIKTIVRTTADKNDYIVKIVPPIRNIELEEITKSYDLIDKKIESMGLVFNEKNIDLDKYKSKFTKKRGLGSFTEEEKTEFVSDTNRKYSEYSLIFEIARYLNIKALMVKKVFEKTSNREEIVKLVSKYNGILYDEIIPLVFNYFYDIREKTVSKPKSVPLISYGKDKDYFVFRSSKNLTIQKDDVLINRYASKSFQTDRYCFDSIPEKELFLKLIESERVKEVYFTGMFTGSENGLSVQYIDPESNIIRTYYPDFLVYYKDGTTSIIEVKGDNRIDDKEVEAKAYAAMELAEHSKMDYELIKSSDIMKGNIDS